MSGSGGGSGGRGGNDDWRPTSSIGSSGGSQSHGSGGGNGGPSPCVFTEVTILASPNLTVIGNLTIGSVLTVALSGVRVVAMDGPNIAGSITSARLADIIQCLNIGQQYEARVIQITGGAVTVEVLPV